MFVLASLKDNVRVPPWQFHLPLEQAIAQELNRKLANKVMLNTGLCITLYNITQLDDSFIFPGDGAAHTKVNFQYVVFRPFVDEILVGKIKSCSREGVSVSLGFFDDIIISSEALQHPSRFDETEQVWVWEYLTDQGKHDLFMDPGEEIRFRVIDESFVDTTPTAPELPDANEGIEKEKKMPYTLMGSINEPGLGLLSWWTS